MRDPFAPPLHSLKCPCKECRAQGVLDRRAKVSAAAECPRDHNTEFDRNPKYGPRSGITRHQRVRRALELSLGLDQTLADTLLQAPDEPYKFAQ